MLQLYNLHTQWRTFSRSYGTILPSSFTRVLSRALVFSTRPPVSVYGTVQYVISLATFPGSLASAPSSLKRNSSSHLSNKLPDLPKSSTYMLIPELPISGSLSLLRHRITNIPSTGILTCFPSTTPFSLALGAD